MSVSRKFLLDANVFIESKNRYYGFDICPGFWSALQARHVDLRVFSIDRIRKELLGHDDEIRTWIEEVVPQTFFRNTDDQDVIMTFTRMMTWV